MYQTSVLFFRQFRYLKLSVLLSLAAIVAYVVTDNGLQPPNGGTVTGYVLGGLAGVLILWLMWLGIRRRHYRSRLGTVQGWVSAHIYLGIAVVFISTLHAGFQFGFNVHTLSYVLLLLVVGSGLYGVFAYLHYPQRLITAHAGLTRQQMMREIRELDQECLMLTGDLAPEIRQSLEEAMAGTRLDSGWWRRLRPPGSKRNKLHKPAALDAYEAYDDTMFVVADHITATRDEAATENLRRILELLGRRNALVERLQISLHYQALLEFWRYFHVPLSFALLAALIVHVVTVFLYW